MKKLTQPRQGILQEARSLDLCCQLVSALGGGFILRVERSEEEICRGPVDAVVAFCKDQGLKVTGLVHGLEIPADPTLIPDVPPAFNVRSCKTAAAAARGALSSVIDRLVVIREEVDAIGRQAKADPKNWGHAGSLAHLDEILRDQVLFLTGQEG